MKSFGQKLKLLRMKTGKSQLEVSQEIILFYPESKLTQTNISRLERQESAPREDVLHVLAEYYGVDINYFYSYETFDRMKEARAYIDEIKLNSAIQVSSCHLPPRVSYPWGNQKVEDDER